MPKLHHRLDGWYYIRTYARSGDDDHNGTWQIRAAGMDVLHQERIIHDEADIPSRLFRYLRDQGLVYTESGPLRPPPRRRPPASSAPTPPVTRRVRRTPNPSFRFAPIIRFVFNEDLSWNVTAGLDHLREPYWGDHVGPLRQIICETTAGRITIGDAVLSVNAMDAEDPFDACVTPVGMSTERYLAKFRGRRPDGSSLSIQIGTTRGICAIGTLFTFHGRRLGPHEPAAWGESYYIVLQTLYTNLNPILDACQPLRLVRRTPWSAYRIRLPKSPDPSVLAYLADIDHAPHDIEELDE